MGAITALSYQELILVSGGECVYNEAKAFWEGIAALGLIAGQPEVVAAAAVMIAYNDYMAARYCTS